MLPLRWMENYFFERLRDGEKTDFVKKSLIFLMGGSVLDRCGLRLVVVVVVVCVRDICRGWALGAPWEWKRSCLIDVRRVRSKAFLPYFTMFEMSLQMATPSPPFGYATLLIVEPSFCFFILFMITEALVCLNEIWTMLHQTQSMSHEILHDCGSSSVNG